MQTLTIGELANATDVPVQTIRFYERQGLIEDPPRRQSGYRQYPAASVARLRFIRRAQRLGFSLREIGGLLALRFDDPAPCDRARKLVAEKIAEIDERIHALGEIRRTLALLFEQCAEEPPASECPFLDALAEASDSGGHRAVAPSKEERQ